MIEQGTLANGVTLLCEPVASTETCAVGFWYPVGSRDERREERGFSHFLEHMLFKGTAQRTALEIAIQVDRVGGTINAFTDREGTCYYCTLPAAHADLALDILCDMVGSATLAEDEIAKEKVVVSNEIRAAEDSPEEQGFQRFVEGMWGTHPLAAKVAGAEQEVKRIARERLASFYATRYHPRNLTVTAAGAVDFDRMARILGERLVARGDAAGGMERVAPTQHRARDYTDGHFQQAQIYVGTTLEPGTDPASYLAFVVFSTAFGESMSSRLFQHIREEEGLCYSVESFRSHYSDVWKWGIYANAIPDLTPQLLSSLNRELHLLAEEPLSPREVDDAISHLTGSMVFAKEDMETRMKRIAGQYRMFGHVLEFEQSAQMLQSIGSGEVAALTSRLLQPERFNLLVYGIRNLHDARRVQLDW